MRSIGAGDVQKIVSGMVAKRIAPKTIPNVWGVISMIWAAALAQKYVDAAVPKPKLPRSPRRNLRCFTMDEVAKIINASEGEHRLFSWLLGETGIRAGEIAIQGNAAPSVSAQPQNVMRYATRRGLSFLPVSNPPEHSSQWNLASFLLCVKTRHRAPSEAQSPELGHFY